MKRQNLILGLILWAGLAMAASVEPTWESLAANYHVPQWFVDGKLGVWFHWGIPSSIDEDRPHDGSHYGAWMYGTEDQLSTQGNNAAQKAVERLTDWHNQRYRHYSKMELTEVLFHFSKDPLEMTNLTNRPEASPMLNIMCAKYDAEVQRWKQQTVAYKNYQQYGILFDRTVPWEEKQIKKIRMNKNAKQIAEGQK